MTNPQNSSSSNNQFTQISEFKFLPHEIWFQILAKLPAKTLLKFRCVCKSWCSIIDNPDFIHIHLQISQISNSGNNNRSLVALDNLGHRYTGETGYSLTLHHLETLRETDLIFRISDSYRYHIIGSCNGLILVNRNQDPPFHGNKELRLWNPCIRKSLVIPACPFHRSLLLDCVYLFGYAAVSKDYKIVAIASEKSVGEELRKMYVAVYTLRDQQWTVRNDGLNISFPNTICMLGPFRYVKASVFLKGVAYWLGNIDENRNHIFHLCSFDFDKEEIAFLELPSSWEESDSETHLFLLGDSLAIFRISEVASSIWVLDQENKEVSWTRRFLGKSSWKGYEVFRLFLFNQRIFFCESDGGFFICMNKLYNLASCELQKPEGLTLISFVVEKEIYLESLALSSGHGARDLRVSP